MKNQFLPVLAILILASCQTNEKSMEVNRYIIETEVNIKPGKTNDVLELFKSTNPELVKEESDWLRASFSKVEGKDIVVVRAEWKDKASYVNFSSSDKFKKTMGQFGKHFAGKPKVTMTRVLFEM